MKEFKAKILGRVQGVAFRDFTKKAADSLGVVGEVANKWDGSVEVVAQGEEALLQQLLEKLKQGPPISEVQDVDVEWNNECSKEYDRFSITG